jgi:hypothetical protein
MSRDEFIAIWNSSDSVDEVKRRTGINHPSERAAVLRRDGYTLKFFGGSQGYEDDRQEFIAIWNSSDSPEEVQERTGLSGVSPKAAKLREMGYELKLMRTMPDTQGYYWAGVFDAKATISFIPNLRLRMKLMVGRECEKRITQDQTPLECIRKRREAARTVKREPGQLTRLSRF